MPSRRALLAGLGAGGAAVLAGCSGAFRPTIHVSFGVGVIHPATDAVLSGGLQTSDKNEFSTVADHPAAGLLGPDAPDVIRRALTGPRDEPAFHAVLQYRSTPDNPRATFVRKAAWQDWWTLGLATDVEPWGSFDSVDEKARRRLENADELVYTSVWSLTPSLDRLPSVETRFRRRG